MVVLPLVVRWPVMVPPVQFKELPVPNTRLLPAPKLPPLTVMAFKWVAAVVVVLRLSTPPDRFSPEAVNAPVSVVLPAATFTLPVPVTPMFWTSREPPAKDKVLANVALPVAP